MIALKGSRFGGFAGTVPVLVWVALTLAAPRVVAHGFIPLPLETVEALLAKPSPGMPVAAPVIAIGDVDGFPPVDADVATFLGADKAAGGLAGQRLVARGAASLPSIATALNDPSTGVIDRFRLQALAVRIDTPGSAQLIVDATERERSGLAGQARAQQLLMSRSFALLSQFSDPAPGIRYAQHLLDAAGDQPAIVAQALHHLAEHKVVSAAPAYERFSAEDQDLDVRYAALHLGGMLGIESSRERIIRLLRDRPDRQRSRQADEYRLLLALGEITTPDGLQEIVDGLFGPQHHFDPDLLRRAVDLAKLKHGDARQRAEAAIAFLDDWGRDRAALLGALRYLVGVGDAQPYLARWRLRDPALVHHLAQLGQTIRIQDGQARFVAMADEPESPGPDSLARALPDLLGDPEGVRFFDTLFVSEADYELLAHETASRGEPYQQHRDAAQARWRVFQQAAAGAGFVPERARLLSTEATVLVGRHGVQTTALSARIEAGGDARTLILDACVFLDGRWQALASPRWQ